MERARGGLSDRLIPGICMTCCTWHILVVLKLKKASSAQNRGLPTTKKSLNAPDQEQRLENTPRVAHGTQRTRAAHDRLSEVLNFCGTCST